MVSGIFQGKLGTLVQSGELSEELVDEAVRRVLEAKFKLGLFDDPYRYGDAAREKKQLLSAEHVAFARELGAKSVVLLKNDGAVLPLRKDLGKLAVIGPLADDARAPLGSWKALGKEEDVVTVLRGLRAAVAEGTEVGHARGCELEGEDSSGLAEAERLARGSEGVVLRHVRRHGRITRREAAELCGLSRPQASRLLGRLVEAGRIVRRGDGGGTWYAPAPNV